MSFKSLFLPPLILMMIVMALFIAFGHLSTPLLILGGISILAMTAGIFVILRLVTQMQGLHKLLASYAKGDLISSVVGNSNGNELDKICWEANKVGANLAEVLGSLRGANNQLGQAITAFEAGHDSLESGASEIRDFSQVVASSAEQASVGTASISQSAGNVSEAVMSVSAAMEEMVATATEIENRCRKENEVVRNAQTEVKSADSAMKELQGLIGKIGAITQVIEEIASQTNLLALNATIEAAGAGEAGKGFTVVANEVKQLSRQTATATGDIRGQVEQIQRVVGTVSQRITSVTRIVGDIDSSSQATLHAVQEQRQATADISQNLAHASTSTHQIARSIEEVLTGSRDTAKSVSKVHVEAEQISHKVVEAGSYVKNIAETTRTLAALIGHFKAKTAKLELSSTLLTRVRTMDDQHRRLVDMLNELNEAVQEGKGKDHILKIIDGLANYAVEHFRDEELVMQQAHYPDFDAHVQIHRTFVDKVIQTRADFEAGRGMVGSEIVSFLIDWLVNHIGKTDKKYGPYANKAGL